MGQNNPKTVVSVPVVRIVPVPVGAAQVVLIVVERPAPQHPVSSACARISSEGPEVLTCFDGTLTMGDGRG